MKKIFLIILLCLFSSSANAGLKEIGNSYVSQETKDQINIQFEENKSKKKNKKFILYFYTDGDEHHIWDWGSAKEITDKFHGKVFQKCNKSVKKYLKREDECSLYILDNKIVWDFVSEKPEKPKRPKRILSEKDKKPGRFFEDQPDVNDDFQIHVIFSLYADSEDNEEDINGKWEQWIKIADDSIFKMTEKANKKTNTMNGEGQRFKWDYRKDGKLDISFFRFPFSKKDAKKKKKNNEGNPMENILIESGFNNPKKIYLNFGGFASNDWAYSTGFPYFSIFKSHKGNKLNTKEFGYFVLHEGLHAMGAVLPCSKNHYQGHTRGRASDLMASDGNGRNFTLDPKNDSYWAHDKKTCPDMQDSVYLTPTSETPFDPFEIYCLEPDQWKTTKHTYRKIKDKNFEKCFYKRIGFNH